MWDFTGGRPDRTRYLDLGFTLEPAAEAAAVPLSNELIASGPLLYDDGSLVLGAAVLLEAPHAAGAREGCPLTDTPGSKCISGSSVGGGTERRLSCRDPVLRHARSSTALRRHRTHSHQRESFCVNGWMVSLARRRSLHSGNGTGARQGVCLAWPRFGSAPARRFVRLQVWSLIIPIGDSTCHFPRRSVLSQQPCRC